MVLVLFILGISIFFLITYIIISNLWFELEIKNFEFVKENNINKKSNSKEKIILHAYIFKNIKIFKVDLNKKKFSNKYLKNLRNNFNNNINISNIKLVFHNFKNLEENIIEVINLKLDVIIGTESVIITSGIVSLLSSIIAILLNKFIEKFDKDKYEYKVMPIYNKNKISIFLDTKIKIKFNIALKLIKNFNKKNIETSNRIISNYLYNTKI